MVSFQILYYKKQNWWHFGKKNIFQINKTFNYLQNLNCEILLMDFFFKHYKGKKCLFSFIHCLLLQIHASIAF